MTRRHQVAALERSPRGKTHAVVFRTGPEVGAVRLEVLRHSRREAKQDRAFHLSPARARDLMRALQSAADEADRLAYRAEKDPSLEDVVRELAEQLQQSNATANTKP